MNLGKYIRLILAKYSNFALTYETIIMIIAKQGMRIIIFKHDKRSFQRNQNLLCELNLRSSPLDQSQSVVHVEFPLYKDF